MAVDLGTSKVHLVMYDLSDW